MTIKQILWFGLTAIFLGWVIWFNIADRMYTYPNVWPIEREGLRILNRAMKEDKTERLGIAVITEKQVYTTQSIDPQKFQLRAAFFEAHQPPAK